MAYFDRSLSFWFIFVSFGFLQIIHLSSLYYSRQWSSVRTADTGRPWGDDRSSFISQRRKGSSSSSSSAAGPGSLRQRINRCCGSLSLSSSAVLSFLCFVGEGTFMVRPFSSSSLAFGWLPFLPNSSTTLKDSGLCGEARSTLGGDAVCDGLVAPCLRVCGGGKQSGAEQILHRHSVLYSSVVTVNLN